MFFKNLKKIQLLKFKFIYDTYFNCQKYLIFIFFEFLLITETNIF